MTPDEIRKLIREEIKAALQTLASSADRLDGYDTDHIESVALGAINRAAEQTADLSHHDPRCPDRYSRYGGGCDCTNPFKEDGS